LLKAEAGMVEDEMRNSAITAMVLNMPHPSAVRARHQFAPVHSTLQPT
jgi:hypothetical protein